MVHKSKENEEIIGANGSLLNKLEKENRRLRQDNHELAKKLDSKRYKIVDFFVDGVYSLVRGNSKKERKEIITRNLNIDKKKSDALLTQKREDVKKGTIDIININFYDWDGKIIYKGGAERYVYDLACLVKKMGYKPRILQCSNEEFEKKYHGVTVIGIGGGSKSDMRENSILFSHFCKNAELVIASPLELACDLDSGKTIGINHGINFDGEWNRYNEDCRADYSVYFKALKNVKKCVCVDTNFINWTRTIDYKSSLKEKYIPNYFDEEKFLDVKHVAHSKITFVYPRRIYNARGADITIEAFDYLLEKYADKIVLKFVGQVDNEKIGKKLDVLMQKYPENVLHEEYEMSEMIHAYEDADVVLVPTRYCEGTSLSCIEGMVSGAAIITTDVGGLPNLVINGYNGLLISPIKEDLVVAVERLINNPEEIKVLSSNGKKVARLAFGKKNWDESWGSIIRDLMSE